jgi:DNA polymerase III subunit delta
VPPATRKPPTSRATAAAGEPKGRSWNQPAVAPLVLVQGPEEYLRELAVNGVKTKAKEKLGEVELVELPIGSYEPGDLAVAASPSLFAEPKVVVITDLESVATADEDILSYLKDPNPDAVVIVVHGGGVRGKKVLDTLKTKDAIVIECPLLKKDAEKADFVHGLLKGLGRKAEPEAIGALIEATGSDLRSLASAATQLAVDIPGAITAESVREYHGGKVEATGFQIADAAIAGDAAKALTLLRHGLAIGLKGPELTGTLASKLRTLAKAAAIRTGETTARDLGMQEWQLRNANNELRSWRPEQLATAVEAIAKADYLIKGGGQAIDTEYALEKAIITVARRR